MVAKIQTKEIVQHEEVFFCVDTLKVTDPNEDVFLLVVEVTEQSLIRYIDLVSK